MLMTGLTHLYRMREVYHERKAIYVWRNSPTLRTAHVFYNYIPHTAFVYCILYYIIIICSSDKIMSDGVLPGRDCADEI